MRVKVGVGEKPKNWDLADYVLSPFTKDERPLVNLAIEHAAKSNRADAERGCGRSHERV